MWVFFIVYIRSHEKIPPNHKKIGFYSENDANNGRVCRIDIVIIYDKQLQQNLESMSTKTYFKKRSILKNENPDGLFIYECDIVPGQSLEPFFIPFNKNKIVSNWIVFCEYSEEPNSLIVRKVICGNSNSQIIKLGKNGVKSMKTRVVKF